MYKVTMFQSLTTMKILIAAVLLIAAPSAQSDEDTESGNAVDEAAALIEAQFNYGIDDLRDQLVVIKHEFGLGNGFIATMDGKSYILTSQPIILGAEKIRFTTLSGKQLRPLKVELSGERGLARLLLAEGTDGFELASEMPMGSLVGVFGGSHGKEMELFGSVTGVGGEIVEVSADFDTENSGSPVLNIDQKAIGIASHVRDSAQGVGKAGTRFENRTRHFCRRLDNLNWRAVNWKKYNKEYGAFYRQNSLFTDGVIEVLDNWAETPRDRVEIVENREKSLIVWQDAHNAILSKNHNNSRKKYFAADYSESLKELAAKCSRRARKIRMYTQQRHMTGFLRQELDQQANTLDYISTLLIRIGNMAQDYR
jgi:hypothetical protein